MNDGQPMRRIEDILHLAELCIDLLQQNDECYAEVSRSWVGLPGKRDELSLVFYFSF